MIPVMETLFMKSVLLFQYRPSKFPDPVDAPKAEKYYQLQGVNDNCQPAGEESELVRLE
jgi:hypothetical protein